jgi:hypothetical protein
MKYFFWLMRVTPLKFHHYWGHILGPTWGVIFSTYNWNPEGKLRNLRRPPFRDIQLPFFFLCNRED